MFITKVVIRNFKGYEKLDLPLQPGMNIIVGDNEAEKSTILEAINLVLSGTIDGKYLTADSLNDYLFNNKVVASYLEATSHNAKPEPPIIHIELHFSEDASADFEGAENILKVKARGVYCRIFLHPENEELYLTLTKEELKSLPLELYTIETKRFSGMEQPRSSMPIRGSFIDTSSNFQNASDLTISRILKGELDKTQKIKASQFYRGIKDNYKEHPIHAELQKYVNHEDASVSLDPTSKNSWDSHLSVYFKEIPFNYVGKGLQTILKTNVSLSSKKTENSSIVLIEEPENHLSFSTLNQLVSMIETKCEGKQILLTSHSSFIANKLGLENLILLHEGIPFPFSGLVTDTKDFFKKLPGYDTLRLLLCKKAILVEGDADELVVQRAFKDIHGKLPIEMGIDVLSVNNTYARFLELAEPLNKKVALIIDMDNRKAARETLKESYSESDFIDVFFEENEPYTGSLEKFNNNTLEPLIFKYNSPQVIKNVLGLDKSKPDVALDFMRGNKTECALKIFESPQKLTYPKYIIDGINFIEPLPFQEEDLF